MRYFRAFWKTVQLTLQGQQIHPPEERYPALRAWVEAGRHRANDTFKAAERAGMDEAARRGHRLHLEGRDLSVEVILGAVRHNFTLEYPMLMAARIEHNLTTLYALNLNDQYRVRQLANDERLPDDLREAVSVLADHLENIPSSNEG